MGDDSKELYPWSFQAAPQAASLQSLLSRANLHCLGNFQEGPSKSFCSLNFLNLMGFMNFPPFPESKEGMLQF